MPLGVSFGTLDGSSEVCCLLQLLLLTGLPNSWFGEPNWLVASTVQVVEIKNQKYCIWNYHLARKPSLGEVAFFLQSQRTKIKIELPISGSVAIIVGLLFADMMGCNFMLCAVCFGLHRSFGNDCVRHLASFCQPRYKPEPSDFEKMVSGIGIEHICHPQRLASLPPPSCYPGWALAGPAL